MPQLVEIVFFALLASYLLFRLWSILGQNTPADEERQNHKKQTDENLKELNNIISLSKQRSDPIDAAPSYSLPYGIKEGIRRIQQEDRTFDVDNFMEGAKAAYELILDEFAKGNKEELRGLLTKDVYEVFKTAIETRETARQRLDNHIEKIDRMDIDGAELYETIARITVRYRTYQVLCTYDDQNNCVDNPAKISKPITDIWTFERDSQSENPNWFLCATRTEGH